MVSAGKSKLCGFLLTVVVSVSLWQPLYNIRSLECFRRYAAGSREMWKKVRKVTGRQKCSRNNCSAVNVEDLNDHCARISTDLCYKTPEPKLTASQNLQLFSEYQVFRMLDTGKPSVFGLDGLPDWFIRLAAPVFAQPFTHLFNLSLEQSVVPSQWKFSCINPS